MGRSENPAGSWPLLDWVAHPWSRDEIPDLIQCHLKCQEVGGGGAYCLTVVEFRKFKLCLHSWMNLAHPPHLSPPPPYSLCLHLPSVWPSPCLSSPPPFSLYLHLSSVSPPPHLTPPLPPRRLQQMAFSTESGSAWGFCLLKESISSPMTPTPGLNQRRALALELFHFLNM